LKHLQQLLGNANEGVEADDFGRLSLSSRRRIWSAIRANSDAANPIQVGHLRCVFLDTLCVRKGLGLWSKVFPNDRGPQEMVSLAFEYLEREVSATEVEKKRDAFFVEVVENRRYKADEYPVSFVGHAAATLYLQPWLTNAKHSLTKESLDAEAYEPSYLVALAFANGLNDSESANIPDRRRFWHWYLNEAVKEAIGMTTAPTAW
jgi:Immunity protein Imm5